MTFSNITYGVADGVATITLNRPDARNALNRAMCEDLVAACSAAADDDNVRLVLVRGDGPVFCAGADLKERKDMSVDEVRNRRLRGFAAYNALEALPMPAIAVVHGRGDRIRQRDRRCLRFHRRDPAGDVLPRPRRCGARSARRSGCRACSASGSPRT